METLLPVTYAVIMAIIGWFVRVLWEADREIRADLGRLREALPREFVLREDYRRDVDEIKHLLRYISSKLDEKVDK